MMGRRSLLPSLVSLLGALALREGSRTARAQAPPNLPTFSSEVEKALLVECCQKKESLQPQTKKIVLDLSAAEPGREIVLSVPEVFERCTPLVERTRSVRTSQL